MATSTATIDRTGTAQGCRCPSQGVHCAWQQGHATALPHGLACPLGREELPADPGPDVNGDGAPPDIWLG